MCQKEKEWGDRDIDDASTLHMQPAGCRSLDVNQVIRLIATSTCLELQELLPRKNSVLEVAAEGGVTRYRAFFTTGQPAGAVSRMAERPNNNKRQRSTSYRKDKDAPFDGYGDLNTAYVPLLFTIHIHLLLTYTTCILPDILHIILPLTLSKHVTLHFGPVALCIKFQECRGGLHEPTPEFHNTLKDVLASWSSSSLSIPFSLCRCVKLRITSHSSLNCSTTS